MKDGSGAMDAWVAKLRELRNLTRDAVPALADATRAAFAQTISSGTDPDGNAWVPRKDGGRPLANAAAALSVKALGLTIVAVISGVEAFHHHGTKKDPRRQILPTRNGLPSSIKEAYRTGLITRFSRVMGG